MSGSLAEEVMSKEIRRLQALIIDCPEDALTNVESRPDNAGYLIRTIVQHHANEASAAQRLWSNAL